MLICALSSAPLSPPLVGDILDGGSGRNLFASTGYGISFNDEGKGFLQGASWVCVSGLELAGGRGTESGFCTVTDQSGDKIWTALSTAGPDAGFDIVGAHTLTN